MIPCQRHLFSIPDEIAYFNCAYFSPQLKSVREAGLRGLDRKDQPWLIGPDDFFTETEQARSLFAGLIGASANDIAIIPSVSYGVAIAVANVKVSRGQEILLLDEQFPSNYYSWAELAGSADTRLLTVGRPQGPGGWTGAILDKISAKTAVVTLPQAHWTDGSLIDLAEVRAKCDTVGAELVLDVTQSVGAMPFSVKQFRPAFLVCAAYKWLMGPYSMAFLYVDPSFQDGKPIEHNWVNREASEDFAGLVNYRQTFQPGARRFDVGERCNFALMPMMVAALTQLLDWGIEGIQETLRDITLKLAESAQNYGLVVEPPERRAGHLFGIRFPGGLPEGILQRLAEDKVFVSLRGDAMRVAPHLHVTRHDIEKLIAVLGEVSNDSTKGRQGP